MKVSKTNSGIYVVGESGQIPATPSPEPSVSITSATSGDVRNTYTAINQMVTDGVIKDYALGGAMGAMFYIEVSSTSDMDMFCALAHEPLASGIVLLNPLTDYLEKKGYKTSALGAIIEGIEVQFQFPADALGVESIATARTFDLDGIPVRVMMPEYLVAHMVKLNRSKDRTRLIRFIETQGFDPSAVFDILQSHGLEDKYSVLETLAKEVGNEEVS